jgi:hypothetical protein
MNEEFELCMAVNLREFENASSRRVVAMCQSKRKSILFKSSDSYNVSGFEVVQIGDLDAIIARAVEEFITAGGNQRHVITTNDRRVLTRLEASLMGRDNFRVLYISTVRDARGMRASLLKVSTEETTRWRNSAL